MRASAAKLALGVVAFLAFGAAAVVIVQSQQQLIALRNTTRGFDVIARESVGALASVKSAQLGYVAPGQRLGTWMARVDTLASDVSARLEELQKTATSREARSLVDEAVATFQDLRALDKRARQYLNSDQALMAADVLFVEGGETAAMAARQVEAARRAEYQALDARENAARQREAYAGGGAALFALLAIAGLILWPARQEPAAAVMPAAVPDETPWPQAVVEVAPAVETVTFPAAPATVDSGTLPVSSDLPRETVPVLTAAAELCIELNRARDVEGLRVLLERAAQVLDASGLVVWVGAPRAAALRPAIAYGYSPQALARMPHVPRTGDNAAAAAFRTGKLQIVLTRPGVSAGALAAPMLTPGGCIGALTAEIKNGGEAHDGVQALIAIFASQLAGILAESVLQSEELEDDLPVSRIASA